MSVEIDRETSGMEQTRPWGDVGLMSGLPESGHDWAIYEYAPYLALHRYPLREL